MYESILIQHIESVRGTEVIDFVPLILLSADSHVYMDLNKNTFGSSMIVKDIINKKLNHK